MTNTPEMVERVARAICEASGENPDGTGAIYPCPRWQHPLALRRARAAIEAMREPTSDMVYEGQGRIHLEEKGGINGPYTYPSFVEIQDAYQAMIDCALGKQP